MMKLIFIIIIIILIYLFLQSVTLYHEDNLSASVKKDINDKKYVKELLSTSKKISVDQIMVPYQVGKRGESIRRDVLVPPVSRMISTDVYPTNQNPEIPSITELIDMIKAEIAEPQFKFNLINLPRETRFYSPSYPDIKMDHYSRKIIKNIKNWNKLFYQYNLQNTIVYENDLITVVQVLPISITETEEEFIMDVNVKLMYQRKTFHLRLKYYGILDKSDDPLNQNPISIKLQLVLVEPITRNEFKTINTHTSMPFVTLDDQLKYVDRINKMHLDEGV